MSESAFGRLMVPALLGLMTTPMVLASCGAQDGVLVQLADQTGTSPESGTAPVGCGYGLAGNGNDPAEMCPVGPGAFDMGSPLGECEQQGGKCPDEKPQHIVAISEFAMDRYEVSNMQFLAFTLDEPQWANGEQTPCDEDYLHSWEDEDPGDSEFGKLPVRWVCWHAASAFCQWAGKSLPSEAEWEYAATGKDHRLYPTGDDPPACIDALYGDCGEDGPGKVEERPGGSSVWGIQDLAGNVAEWINDGYAAAYYCGEGGTDLAACTEPDGGWMDPAGPGEAGEKVVRGGGWSDELFWLRVSARQHFSPDRTAPNLGFRCGGTPYVEETIERGD